MRSMRAATSGAQSPWIRSACACALIGLAGCGDETPAPREVVRPVKIIEVGQRAEERREYPGRIRTVQYSEMGFEVPGRIVEFSVTEGDRVKKGQVLARLDQRDYQAALAKATAKLQHAASERDRMKTLYEKNVKPKAEYDLRERLFEVEQANVATARKAVEDSVLRAPFDGVLARKLVSDFRNVPAKESVLIVQDDSSLVIKASVPERDLTQWSGKRPSAAEITERIRPRVVVSALPDREFGARLTELASVADPTTRTFEATFAFAKPDGVNVLGGMTAKVRIDVPAREQDAGVSLPTASVVSDSSETPYVWVVDPGTMKVTQRRVGVGSLGGSQVRIESGLDAGEWVVVSGVHQLREGDTVRRAGS
jgi:RND family efflux transporter MFP subunit